MSQKFTLQQIRQFWAEQARRFGPSPAASWSDVSAIELEVREILKHLVDGDNLLDVGCANGFSTVQLASRKEIRVRGIDYVPEMIEQARRRLKELPDCLRRRVSFDVGDITALSDPVGSYDKVSVVRVLINLGSWGDAQAKALRECGRVLRPGGLLLLSEATWQGWNRLNRLRVEWGLPQIPMPPFNNYVDEEKLVNEASSQFDLVELSNFASTYYVGTRVLKPLLALTTSAPIDVADPGVEWNRWFAQLPAFGDYGTQKLFVLRRK